MALRTPNQVMRQWVTCLTRTFDAVQAALVFEYEEGHGLHVIARSGRVHHLIDELERHSPIESGYISTKAGILWLTQFDNIIATLTTMAYRTTLHAETTNRYQALMKALHATTLMIVSKHSLDSIFAQVLSGLALLVPYDSAAVMLLDEDEATFRVAAAVGFEDEHLQHLRINALDDALFQEIVHHKIPIMYAVGWGCPFVLGNASSECSPLTIHARTSTQKNTRISP